MIIFLLAAKKYKVSVVTGDVARCGTDANVFMTMYGQKGDSGERKLHTSETHRDKFEKGQVCHTFTYNNNHIIYII